MSCVHPPPPGSPPAAVTPGRAAREAWERRLAAAAVPAGGFRAADTGADLDAAWDDAARAAITAADVPPLLVKFEGTLTEEQVAEIRKRLETACHDR